MALVYCNSNGVIKIINTSIIKKKNENLMECLELWKASNVKLTHR